MNFGSDAGYVSARIFSIDLSSRLYLSLTIPYTYSLLLDFFCFDVVKKMEGVLLGFNATSLGWK